MLPRVEEWELAERCSVRRSMSSASAALRDSRGCTLSGRTRFARLLARWAPTKPAPSLRNATSCPRPAVSEDDLLQLQRGQRSAYVLGRHLQAADGAQSTVGISN